MLCPVPRGCLKRVPAAPAKGAGRCKLSQVLPWGLGTHQAHTKAHTKAFFSVSSVAADGGAQETDKSCMSCTSHGASHAQHADFASQCRNLLHRNNLSSALRQYLRVNVRVKATAAVLGRRDGVVPVTVPGGAAARAAVAARLSMALDAFHALSTPLQSTLFARARGGAGGADGGAAGRDVPMWRLRQRRARAAGAHTVPGVASSVFTYIVFAPPQGLHCRPMRAARPAATSTCLRYRSALQVR